jgi:FkbM family methyltransferase
LAREAYAIPHRFLDPDRVHTIVDCGANTGITALYFATKYKHARIISIEPDPDNFNVLKQNVAGHDRIEPIWAAVVGRAGPVHLTQNRPAYGNAVQCGDLPGPTIEVPGHTISALCEAHGIQSIDLLKIDIEGAEKEVFLAPVFLPAVGVVAIELHAPYGLSEFTNDIAPFGFRAMPPGASACRHVHLAMPDCDE